MTVRPRVLRLLYGNHESGLEPCHFVASPAIADKLYPRQAKSLLQNYPARSLFPLMSEPGLGEFGVESIPPGSGVPWHRHDKQNEIISVHKGHLKLFYYQGSDWRPNSASDNAPDKVSMEVSDEDHAIIDGGVLGPMESVHIPPGVWHHFINYIGDNDIVSDNDDDNERHTVWLQYMLLPDRAAATNETIIPSLTEQIGDSQ